GAEKLDIFVPEFLVVTVKFALALRAGHPKYFRHGSSSHQRNKIRNPNIEIRNKLGPNKFKIRKSKTANSIHPVWNILVALFFIILNLFRISDFEFRILGFIYV
ncbi:MAG TPA: hypothetical protein VMR20_14990, partial [Verrucomicrobiae bacterium]|nr:hypothetical protein [Verrucomicrobiae bacterium]